MWRFGTWIAWMFWRMRGRWGENVIEERLIWMLDGEVLNLMMTTIHHSLSWLWDLRPRHRVDATLCRQARV
jgi:hypothetical protein